MHRPRKWPGQRLSTGRIKVRKMTETRDMLGRARVGKHGGDDLQSGWQESQQSSSQTPSASNPAPMQQDAPAQLHPQTKACKQVEVTAESPAQADNARGLKTAGKDIRDIAPDALFAMYTDVRAWTKARAQVYAHAPSILEL